ncbi:MAG: response regulator, partial [Blautia sp.]|uniref:LytR/AlgR family response regulator transcription factor n=1 Tax=Blautia sp. TaxID=1955243 RepID=UPI002E7984E9
MLHIAICDDEQDFVQHLKTMLNQYADEIGEEIKVTVYYDGLELIEEYDTTIDLIFLDIQMNGVDGLKAAEQIRKKDENVGIIFLTSLKQYALEGYKYQAVNYVVKPMKYIRLKVELNRWKEKYRKKNPYIVVRNDNGSFKIDLSTLHYAETYKRNLLLHTGFIRNYPYHSTLTYISFAAKSALLHLPYIVRFTIFNLLFVPSTKPFE